MQSEFHAVVVRRELLECMGGLDEGLLSWFDHTDLALHHQRLGAAAWLVPDVTCRVPRAPAGFVREICRVSSCAGAEDWYERSLDRLCNAWDLDRTDSRVGDATRDTAPTSDAVSSPAGRGSTR